MYTEIAKSFNANRPSPRAGFILAPLLYMLALGGIGAAVIFSGYSQILRSNAEMAAINTVRQQLNSAGQTLSASAALDTPTSTIVQPPPVATFASVTDIARLPGNYANVGLTGTPHDSGIIDVTTGVRQLDPWGKYYIYCRWENKVSLPSTPSIMVISAGPDGVLSTKCGDTVAQGDDRINKLNVAEAINRANVWQVNTASQVKFGIAATAVKVNDDGSIQAASLTLTTPLAITSGGTGAADAPTARVNLNVPSTTGLGANGIWGIDITGNAATATALKTARQFSIAGATGLTAAATPFDGTADVALNLAGTLAIANGGTGATTAAAARTNLAVLGIANNLSDVASAATARTNLAVLGIANNLSDVASAATARTNLAVLGIANNLSDVANAATARTNLGLGTMAVQDANNVAITGGTITGVTITGNVSGSAGSVTGIVPLANGGTGVNATSNANLRNQLGIDNASNLLSGYVGTGLLGTGVANTTTFLRGDGAWATVPVGVTALSALSDVALTSPTNGQVLQYNGTKWVNAPGAGIAAGGTAPSFSVNKNGTNQTITSNSWQKLTWSTIAFDTNNNWSPAGNRYAPTIAGKYMFILNTSCGDAIANGCYSDIFKNGTQQVQSQHTGGNNGGVPSVAIYDMNGTTDYVESYVWNSGGTTILGNQIYSSFSGALLAPLASGSVAGTGTTNYIPKWSNSTNLTNSLVFDNGTNVGIGTTTPSETFQINSTSGNYLLAGAVLTNAMGLRLGYSSDARVWLTTNAYTDWGGTGGFPNNGSGGLRLGTGSTFAYLGQNSGNLLINPAGGNVGIGTTSPIYPLTVYGNERFRMGTNQVMDFIPYIAGSSGVGIRSINDANSAYQPLELNASNLIINAAGGTGNVGIGTTTPAAALDVTSTTSGFLPPRMTTAQRDAIATPATGLQIYNTTTNALNVYNGTAWGGVGSGGGGGGSNNAAFVRFSANTCTTNGATCTIVASKNVASVTRVSASYSIYKIAFTTSMPDANYAFDVSAGTSINGATNNEFPQSFLSDKAGGFGSGTGTGATTSSLEFGILYANGGGSYGWTNFDTISVYVPDPNAGGSGGGASALSGLTDTNITTPANNDILRYDSTASKWKNVNIGTAMGTTTMVANWPDAIQCFDGSGNSTWAYLQFKTSTYTEYAVPADNNSTRYIISYTPAGAYNTSSTVMSAQDCVTSAMSISQLYAAGRAFNFIGSSLASAAAPAGGVQFNNGAGVLAGDAALVWDNTNKRLGVGIATPSYDLHVSKVNAGGGVTSMVANPATTAGTYASLYALTGTTGAYAQLSQSDGAAPYAQLAANSGDTGGLYIDAIANAPIMLRTNGGLERLRVTAAGNVGIGTTSPSTALQVNGTITSTGETVNGTATATTFSGSGASLTSLNASNLSSGTVDTARLGTGTASSTTYLRGDQTWATVSNSAVYACIKILPTGYSTFTPSAGQLIGYTLIGGGGGSGGGGQAGNNGSLVSGGFSASGGTVTVEVAGGGGIGDTGTVGSGGGGGAGYYGGGGGGGSGSSYLGGGGGGGSSAIIDNGTLVNYAAGGSGGGASGYSGGGGGSNTGGAGGGSGATSGGSTTGGNGGIGFGSYGYHGGYGGNASTGGAGGTASGGGGGYGSGGGGGAGAIVGANGNGGYAIITYTSSSACSL